MCFGRCRYEYVVDLLLVMCGNIGCNKIFLLACSAFALWRGLVAWAAGVVSASLHHLLLAKLYLVIVQKKLCAAKDIVLADRAVYICVQPFGQIF